MLPVINQATRSEASIAERALADRVPYDVWRAQGFLTVIPGRTIDNTVIESRIHELMTQYEVVRVSVDPWNAHDLIQRLERDGVPIVTVAQTMANLSSPSKALESLILSGKLRHDGNPILRWCVSNAVADVDGNGNVKPSKKRSRERIDGVSALVTALDGALRDPASVYESRGLIVL
jgi:phage terminase large subunit-like protein